MVSQIANNKVVKNNVKKNNFANLKKSLDETSECML